MSTSTSSECSVPESAENLNESWVELNFSRNANGGSSSGGSSSGGGNVREHSIHNGNMEKLLIEALHESGQSSRASTHGSGQHSPQHSPVPINSVMTTPDRIQTPILTSEQSLSFLPTTSPSNATEWIWDWSSRPESQQQKEMVEKLKHPSQRAVAKLSMRKSKAIRSGVLSAEFLTFFIPTILVSHLVTLGVGIYIGQRLGSSNTA